MTRGKQDSDAMVLEGVGGEFTSYNLVCVELYRGDKATTVTHCVPREKVDVIASQPVLNMSQSVAHGYLDVIHTTPWYHL